MRARLCSHLCRSAALLSLLSAACASDDPAGPSGADTAPIPDLRDLGVDAPDAEDAGRSDLLADSTLTDSAADAPDGPLSDGDLVGDSDAPRDAPTEGPVTDSDADAGRDLTDADARDDEHPDGAGDAHDDVLGRDDSRETPDVLGDAADSRLDTNDATTDAPPPLPSRIRFGEVLPGEERTSIEVVLDNREPIRGLNLLFSGAPLDRFEGTLGIRTADVGWRLSESESAAGWRVLSSSDSLSPLPAEEGVLFILRLSPTAAPSSNGLVCFEQVVLPTIDDPPRVLTVEIGPCLCYAPPCP